MGESIGDIAVRLVEDRMRSADSAGDGGSRVIFVLGDKGCGKSSLINSFLEKEEQPRETLGLEYTYGRKALPGQLGGKSVCHVWEAGGRAAGAVLRVPRAAHPALPLAALLLVDASRPRALWPDLRLSLERLRAPEAALDLQQLYIVAGKYDLYKELDAKSKASVCKMLRCAALLSGAGVFFYSNRERALVKRSREILNFLGFGVGSPPRTAVQEPEKGIQVATGEDSWAAAGDSGEGGWEGVQRRVAEVVQGGGAATESGERAPPPDPSLEPAYREPLLDALRTRKDNQLLLILGAAKQNYF